jgi:energy-coupling factor transport system ATP-binding protein
MDVQFLNHQPENAQVSVLPRDLIHATALVIFILTAAEPMPEKLNRIKIKYGLVE